jgi:hypothetical protein
LNLAVARHAAKIERLEVLPDSTRAGRLGRARVHAVFDADVRGLVGVLHALAVGDAALTVADLRIVVTDPASAEHLPELLKVELTIDGWYPRGT